MSEDQKDKYPTEGESRPTFEGTKLDDADLHKVHSQLMREKEEPTENFSPMPLLLVAIFMVLSFWAGIYLVRYSGNFGLFHYDETLAAGPAENTGPREVDMMALGKKVYARNCVACHQGTGLGLPSVYPPLVDSDWVKDNPERLIKVVLAGMAGPVIVNGNEYNNAMTAFGTLKDQHIAAVLTYIRTEPTWNNNSFPVSEELVAQVREAYGARAEPWSQAELDAIHGPVTGIWEPPAAPEAPAPVEGEVPEAAEEVVEEADAGTA
ncbi:MAG: cytochrome c [Puniceicoccaceae bacterium]